MRSIARLMLVLFAAVTISGHGAAQPVVYHAQDHHQTDAHANGVMDGHDHQVAAIITPSGTASVLDFCAPDSCEAPENDQSGGHMHISCCGGFIALLPNELAAKTLAYSVVDQSIGRSSLALGELRYPLLRPPCQSA